MIDQPSKDQQLRKCRTEAARVTVFWLLVAKLIQVSYYHHRAGLACSRDKIIISYASPGASLTTGLVIAMYLFCTKKFIFARI